MATIDLNTMCREEVVDFWTMVREAPGIPKVTGMYPFHSNLHPSQNPNIPFIYDPAMDCYVGFHWNYTDCSPLPPIPTYENLSKLKGFYLSSDPQDYYEVKDKWDSRLVAVYFRVNNLFFYHGTPMQSNTFNIEGMPYTDEMEVQGVYYDYRVHEGLKPLLNAGYDSILTKECTQSPAELFLGNPALQIMKTQWWDWKKQ